MCSNQGIFYILLKTESVNRNQFYRQSLNKDKTCQDVFVNNIETVKLRLSQFTEPY